MSTPPFNQWEYVPGSEVWMLHPVNGSNYLVRLDTEGEKGAGYYIARSTYRSWVGPLPTLELAKNAALFLNEMQAYGETT